MTSEDLAAIIIARRKRDRRIARWATALFFVALFAWVAGVFFFYHPENAPAAPHGLKPHHARLWSPRATAASSYVHLDACKSSLRGGGGSDDDIHTAGVASHATGFVGWSSTYTRVSDTSLYVKGLLSYSGGQYLWWTGHCWDHDFGPDTLS